MLTSSVTFLVLSQAISLICNKTSFPGASTYSTTAPKSKILITLTLYILFFSGLNVRASILDKTF